MGMGISNFFCHNFNMLTLNLSDKVVLDSTSQYLSKDMLHGWVLTNSSKGLPCPHFFHGNGIFPILKNVAKFDTVFYMSKLLGSHSSDSKSWPSGASRHRGSSWNSQVGRAPCGP